VTYLNHKFIHGDQYMKHYIRKIVTSVVEIDGHDVPETSFEYYEVVNKISGRVIGVSDNIEMAVAILKKEESEEALRNPSFNS
jgi:tRNA U38,U39,U40 pseudouridine synthase TruA